MCSRVWFGCLLWHLEETLTPYDDNLSSLYLFLYTSAFDIKCLQVSMKILILFASLSFNNKQLKRGWRRAEMTKLKHFSAEIPLNIFELFKTFYISTCDTQNFDVVFCFLGKAFFRFFIFSQQANFPERERKKNIFNEKFLPFRKKNWELKKTKNATHAGANICVVMCYFGEILCFDELQRDEHFRAEF